MRLARPSAFILALLAAALIWTAVWYVTPEVSAELPVVNGPMNAPTTRLDRVADVAPFRCDSLVAQDCFEMLHRRTTNVTTSVPFAPLFDHNDLVRVGRTETDACRTDAFDRSDRCLKHESR